MRAISTRARAYQALGALLRSRQVRGKRHLAEWLVRHPADLTYRDVDGMTRRTDLSDLLEAWWLLGINFGLPASVLARVRPGDTVVDAGANIGAVTGQLARAVGAAGRVVAFEPLPANVRRLADLKRDNDLGQIEIAPYALSDHSGTATLRLHDSRGTSGYASFTASWLEGDVIDVDTCTLDAYMGDSALSFIKLDVEGAEALVLRGAAHILANQKPLVYCEFNDILLCDAGSSGRELLGTFNSLGYAPVPDYADASRDLDGAFIDLLLGFEGSDRPHSR